MKDCFYILYFLKNIFFVKVFTNRYNYVIKYLFCKQWLMKVFLKKGVVRLRCVSFVYTNLDIVTKLKETKKISTHLLYLTREEILKGIYLNNIPTFLNIDKYFAVNLFLNLVNLRTKNNKPLCLCFFPDLYQLTSYRLIYPNGFIAVRLDDIFPSMELFVKLTKIIDLLILDLSIYDDKVYEYEQIIRKKMGKSEVIFTTMIDRKGVSF